MATRDRSEVLALVEETLRRFKVERTICLVGTVLSFIALLGSAFWLLFWQKLDTRVFIALLGSTAAVAVCLARMLAFISKVIDQVLK